MVSPPLTGLQTEPDHHMTFACSIALQTKSTMHLDHRLGHTHDYWHRYQVLIHSVGRRVLDIVDRQNAGRIIAPPATELTGWTIWSLSSVPAHDVDHDID